MYLRNVANDDGWCFIQACHDVKLYGYSNSNSTGILTFNGQIHKLLLLFAAVNHNYDHKLQRTFKHSKSTQKGTKSNNHKSQTMTFTTRGSKLPFSERSAKMVNVSEELER